MQGDSNFDAASNGSHLHANHTRHLFSSTLLIPSCSHSSPACPCSAACTNYTLQRGLLFSLLFTFHRCLYNMTPWLRSYLPPLLTPASPALICLTSMSILTHWTCSPVVSFLPGKQKEIMVSVFTFSRRMVYSYIRLMNFNEGSIKGE